MASHYEQQQQPLGISSICRLAGNVGEGGRRPPQDLDERKPAVNVHVAAVGDRKMTVRNNSSTTPPSSSPIVAEPSIAADVASDTAQMEPEEPSVEAAADSSHSGMSRRQRKNLRKQREKVVDGWTNANFGGADVPDAYAPHPGGDDGGGGGGGGIGNNNNRKLRSCSVIKNNRKNLRDFSPSASAAKNSFANINSIPRVGTYAKLNMSDKEIYYWIYSYCLDKTRLRHLGFPLDSELHPGKTVIYVDPDVCMLTESELLLCGDEDQDESAHHHHLQQQQQQQQERSEPTSTIKGPSKALDANAQEFVPLLKSDILPAAPREEDMAERPDVEKPEELKRSNHQESLKLVASSSSLSADAKEFVPSSLTASFSPTSAGKPPPESSSSSCAPEARQCVRCFRTFFMDQDGTYINKEKCHYHWGKVRRTNGSGGTDSGSGFEFSCCRGLSSSAYATPLQGCCTGKVHVWRGRLFQVPGMHGPFDNYIRTRRRKSAPLNGYHGVYALDCEMCYTSQGMDLIRVSVVGVDGRPVYDTLVLPEHPVVDYNTRFSGVTERDLKTRPAKSLKEVQNDLMGFISASTILVGHGLENDFRALRLVHTLVVDTSILYPHFLGVPFRRSLKSLTRCYLKREIQSENRSGHDSFEDARASLELVLHQVKTEYATALGAQNKTKEYLQHQQQHQQQQHRSPTASPLCSNNSNLIAPQGTGTNPSPSSALRGIHQDEYQEASMSSSTSSSTSSTKTRQGVAQQIFTGNNICCNSLPAATAPPWFLGTSGTTPPFPPLLSPPLSQPHLQSKQTHLYFPPAHHHIQGDRSSPKP